MTRTATKTTAKRLVALRNAMQLLLAQPYTAIALADALECSKSCARDYIDAGLEGQALEVIGNAPTSARQFIVRAISQEAIETMLLALAPPDMPRKKRLHSVNRPTMHQRRLADAAKAGRRIIDHGDATGHVVIPPMRPVRPDPDAIISGAWLARAAA